MGSGISSQKKKKKKNKSRSGFIFITPIFGNRLNELNDILYELQFLTSYTVRNCNILLSLVDNLIGSLIFESNQSNITNSSVVTNITSYRRWLTRLNMVLLDSRLDILDLISRSRGDGLLENRNVSTDGMNNTLKNLRSILKQNYGLY
jgi:hypothetical protein